jgi:hypothetical protein
MTRRSTIFAVALGLYLVVFAALERGIVHSRTASCRELGPARAAPVVALQPKCNHCEQGAYFRFKR